MKINKYIVSVIHKKWLIFKLEGVFGISCCSKPTCYMAIATNISLGSAPHTDAPIVLYVNKVLYMYEMRSSFCDMCRLL